MTRAGSSATATKGRAAGAPLNGEERRCHSEAALGPVIDLSQQHLSLRHDSAEPLICGLELVIGRLQLAGPSRYSSLQLGSQRAQLIFGIVASRDVEECPRVVHDASFKELRDSKKPPPGGGF